MEGQGGYATIEGSAKTSTGREASGRCSWPAATATASRPYAGSVNTKYNGNYNVAACAQPLRRLEHRRGRALRRQGDDDAALRLPHHHLLRPAYYSYGGAYYRPYTYRGVPYYYPVPAPYYAYYDSPPGAP